MNLIFQRESALLMALTLHVTALMSVLSLSLDYGLEKVEIVQLIPAFLGGAVFCSLAIYRRTFRAKRLISFRASCEAMVIPFVVALSVAYLSDVLFRFRGISTLSVFGVASLAAVCVHGLLQLAISGYISYRAKNSCPATIVIVGNNLRSSKLIERWQDDCLFPVEINGYIDATRGATDYATNPQQETLRYLGPVEKIEEILTSQVVDEIWMTLPIRSQFDRMNKSVAVCETIGIPVRLSPSEMFASRRGDLRQTNGRWADDLSFVALPGKPWKLVVKRLFDVTGSAALMLLCAPLLLIIALIIKTTSKGPVFYTQKRCGLHGRLFKLYKFRSMIVDADGLKTSLSEQNELAGPAFKMKKDPRITSIGSFIRKTSIDELPQLWNVFRGEMSLVGPRPSVPQEVEKYEAWQRRRLSVKPGLTCTWQVSGRNNITFDKWMQMDLEYIHNWSLRQDILLVCKTIPAVLFMRGAY